MSFYLTLPSDSNGSEFPDNKSNSFKVRLPDPIRLEGEWEAGLAAISLPDATPQLKQMVQFKNNYFMQVAWVEVDVKGAAKDRLRTKFFRIEHFEAGAPKDGVDLCKMFVAHCKNLRVCPALDHEYRKSKTFEKNGKLLYPDLKMDGEDMVLDYSKVDANAKGIYLDFDEGFAAAMKWIHYEDDGTVRLGANLQITLEKTGDLDDGSVIQDVQRDGGKDALYWTVKQGWLFLSRHASWRFVNVREAFANITDYKSRSLFIYSNVGQSQVVGNKVTDLLREVSYRTVGAGNQYIEPAHVQYKKVRNNVLDILEVQVSETDGRLTALEEGVTTLTLHLRQQQP